jgi:hypothetical protein
VVGRVTGVALHMMTRFVPGCVNKFPCLQATLPRAFRGNSTDLLQRSFKSDRIFAYGRRLHKTQALSQSVKSSGALPSSGRNHFFIKITVRGHWAMGNSYTCNPIEKNIKERQHQIVSLSIQIKLYDLSLPSKPRLEMREESDSSSTQGNYHQVTSHHRPRGGFASHMLLNPLLERTPTQTSVQELDIDSTKTP